MCMYVQVNSWFHSSLEERRAAEWTWLMYLLWKVHYVAAPLSQLQRQPLRLTRSQSSRASMNNSNRTCLAILSITCQSNIKLTGRNPQTDPRNPPNDQVNQAKASAQTTIQIQRKLLDARHRTRFGTGKGTVRDGGSHWRASVCHGRPACPETGIVGGQKRGPALWIQ